MELEKGEFVPDNSYRGKGEGERLDFGPGRGRKMEIENGEFVPENNTDIFRRKEGACTESDNRKRSFSSSWQPNKSSRAPEEEPGEFKHEPSNGKGRDKEYYAENWPKRHCMEPENSGRKHPPEFSDSSRSKSRKKGEEDNPPPRASYAERSYGNPPPLSSSKVSSSSRYTSAPRHHEPGSHSRLSHDKQSHRNQRDRTPSYSERSPMERARHPDRRDRSPVHPERSSLERARHPDRRDRSPAHPERSAMERACRHDRRDGSPVHAERSPIERARHLDTRDWSPAHRARSPKERAHHHYHRHYREQSPSHSDRSPLRRSRYHDHRDLAPAHLDRSLLERSRHYDHRERSPHDRERSIDQRDKSKKGGGGEKQQTSKYEERSGRRDSGGKDTSRNGLVRQLNNSSSPSTSFERSGSDDKPGKKKDLLHSVKEPSELPPLPPSPPPPPPPILPPPPLPPQPDCNGVDELPSMEEDMDICDTPPHDTMPDDTKLGKWFYLDYLGVEQGPSKLDDLKRLMEDGFLPSDHLIKHSDSDRWVTVENAASPLVQLNLPSIVSDAVTVMVSPPEAPGNLLIDAGDVSPCSSSPSLQKELGQDGKPVAVEIIEEFHIVERIDALLDGYNVIDGKELETIGGNFHLLS